MKNATKPQFTPRLPSYSGRYNYSDKSTHFLSRRKRTEIRIALERHRYERTRQLRAGASPLPAIHDAHLDRALDEVSNICWTYRDDGAHLEEMDIGKQKKNATAIKNSASGLVKALAKADPEIRKRMYLRLAVEGADVGERIVSGWTRYRHLQAKISAIEELAIDARKRAKKVYDSEERQKPLPYYASTFLHELVAVWCDLFNEPFRISISDAKPTSTKKGTVIPIRLGGLDFVLLVIRLAGHNWDAGVVRTRLAKVRDKRAATTKENSEKATDSDKGRHEVRRLPR